MVKFSSSLTTMLFIGLVWFLGGVINVNAHELNVHEYDPVPLQEGATVSEIALVKTRHASHWKRCPVINPITGQRYSLNHYNRLPVGAIVYVPLQLERSAFGVIDSVLFSAYLKKHSPSQSIDMLFRTGISTSHVSSFPIATQDVVTSLYNADRDDIDISQILHSALFLIGVVILLTIVLIVLQRRLRSRMKLTLLGRDIIDHLCEKDDTLDRSELYSHLSVGFFTKHIVISGMIGVQNIQILHDIIAQSRFAAFSIMLNAVQFEDCYMRIALEAKNIKEFAFNNKSREDEIAFCTGAYEFGHAVFEEFYNPRRNSLDPEPMTRKIRVDAIQRRLEVSIIPTEGHTFPSLTQEPERTNTFQRFEKVRAEIDRAFGDSVVVCKPHALKRGILLSFSFSKILSSEIITSTTKEIT